MENEQKPALTEKEIVQKMKETLDTEDLWSLENARDELLELNLKHNSSKEYLKKLESTIAAKHKKIRKEKEEEAKKQLIYNRKNNNFKKSRMIFLAIILVSIYIFKKVGMYLDVLLVLIILFSALNMFRSYRVLKK